MRVMNLSSRVCCNPGAFPCCFVVTFREKELEPTKDFTKVCVWYCVAMMCCIVNGQKLGSVE